MLERIFQYDNAFWRFMGRLGDFLILNLLFFLCCIPLVTAGVGLCAMFYVMYKIIEHENGGTLRNFWHSFRQNLLQGLILTVVLLILGWFLWYIIAAVMFSAAAKETQGAAFYLAAGGCGFLLFLYLVLLLYVFPLQARFYNRVPVTLLNALVFGIRNLPRTLLMLCADGALFLITAASVIYAPRVSIIPILFALPLGVWCNARILSRVLQLTPGKGDQPVSDDEKQRAAEESP